MEASGLSRVHLFLDRPTFPLLSNPQFTGGLKIEPKLNLSNKEIAVRLNISERTVKFHVSALLEKFHVESRIRLILESLALRKQACGDVSLPNK